VIHELSDWQIRTMRCAESVGSMLKPVLIGSREADLADPVQPEGASLSGQMVEGIQVPGSVLHEHAIGIDRAFLLLRSGFAVPDLHLDSIGSCSAKNRHEFVARQFEVRLQSLGIQTALTQESLQSVARTL
jgi:hypothetical protein